MPSRVAPVITASLLLLTVSGPRGQGRSGGVHLSSARDQAAALQNELVGGVFNAVCTSMISFGSNVMANCDSIVLPHNETAIVVDPNDPSHLAAGSNATQLPPNGATGSARSALDYYTSFDGGLTWLNGSIPAAGFAQTSDPSFGFDTGGNAFAAMVSFDLGLGGKALGGAIQVAHSSNGGRTFAPPTNVEISANDAVQEDKPYLTVDTNPTSPFVNSVYVTWSRFHLDSLDNYLESPIFFSGSRDGGQTWSPPKEISGSNPAVCTFSGTPLANDGRCKEDQFSSPIVGPDGTIFVAFENEQAINDGEFRNQYLVVKSHDGGETWAAPVRASDIIHDGATDYPVNVVGRQTLSHSQFRVNSAGNLAVDPASGGLVVTWSDNRHGTAAATNTDVFMSRSIDGGNSWSMPSVVSGVANDQFYPWAAVAPDGTINISFFDRSYDPANSQYGMTLARLAPHTRSVSPQRVDAGLSDPNHARWFAAATGGKTIFLGDYNGLAIGADGVSHPFWTDMRRVVTVRGIQGATEDAFTTSVR